MTLRLEVEPTAKPRNLAELMGIAMAMEAEAVARYGELAAAMRERGERGLAETFGALLEEERAHVAEVERWSLDRTGAAPPKTAHPWRLPPEIAGAWDEAMASATLTPYRALTIAVHNEERGFAFYTYVAAHSDDADVRAAAERLAEEELHHAAVLRRERRRAWRLRRAAHPAPLVGRAISLAAFASQSAQMESRAAATHAAIAERLADLGDDASAAALRDVAADELQAAGGVAAEPARLAIEQPGAVDRDSPGALLRAGLAETEILHEAYVDLADHAIEEPALIGAQAAALRAVRNIGRIAARLHALEA